MGPLDTSKNCNTEYGVELVDVEAFYSNQLRSHQLGLKLSLKMRRRFPIWPTEYFNDPIFRFFFRYFVSTGITKSKYVAFYV